MPRKCEGAALGVDLGWFRCVAVLEGPCTRPPDAAVVELRGRGEESQHAHLNLRMWSMCRWLGCGQGAAARLPPCPSRLLLLGRGTLMSDADTTCLFVCLCFRWFVCLHRAALGVLSRPPAWHRHATRPLVRIVLLDCQAWITCCLDVHSRSIHAVYCMVARWSTSWHCMYGMCGTSPLSRHFTTNALRCIACLQCGGPFSGLSAVYCIVSPRYCVTTV